MSDSAKKRWLIKDSEGRVRGPFYTDDVLKRIKNGEFSGEEFISLYPSADWSPISNDPTFYDKLLEILEGAPAEEDRGQVISPPEDIADDFVQSRSAEGQKKTEAKAPPPKNRAERVTLKRTDEPEPEKEKEHEPKQHKTIELKSRRKAIKKATAKKTTVPLIVATAVFLGAIYLMVTPETRVEDRIHLLAPRKGQPTLPNDQLQAKQKMAVGDYVKDNFSNYVRAEETLVQIVEANPKNQGALALLCLDYLELWPYAYQDSKDLYALTVAEQMASAIDAAGFEAATCRAVDFINRGRFVEAKNVADTIMDSFSGSGQPPIAFYYLKAKLFDVSKDYSSAISYAQTAEQLWPQWLRAYSFEARMQSKNKNFSEAANRYRSILKANPNHKVAQVELGVIEFENLQNYQTGKQILEAAMKMAERAPRDVMSRGYLGLAEVSMREQDNSNALNYAQKSYALNSDDPRSKEIILKIGGEKKLRETKVLDSQLVYEGDQLVREGDCNAAQAHFKEAFEANHKNGIAAMKAAQCLWDLSLSTEAIEWLNKAIQADPYLIDAYVLLADYFTQRFNYEAAGQVLAKAKAISPNSNKVYGGYALVEFRRNNFIGAINYANKAIQIYETDVDSYVILARALIQNQQYPKAFESASKAVELDINNKNAQIVYAESLGMTRGLNVGIDYLTRLVSTYPTLTEYRMALGLMYERDQSYTSAEQVFDQVVRIEDKPKQAYLELGKVLQLERRYDDALIAFFKAAELDPADVEALYLAGLLYLDAKKPSEARTQFQHVLKINKDYPLVNYQLGRAALDLDAPQEALEQAKIEITKNPNLADPYLLSADAHTAMRQYELCAGDYLQAVKLRPQGADFYVKMARCYRLSGNLESAQSMINQASRQESGNPELWKEQGAIYETQEQRVKAIEAYNQYLTLAPNAIDRDQVQMRIKTLSQ
jgi:tetratricopeptide (TPR) repeat protein